MNVEIVKLMSETRRLLLAEASTDRLLMQKVSGALQCKRIPEGLPMAIERLLDTYIFCYDVLNGRQ